MVSTILSFLFGAIVIFPFLVSVFLLIFYNRIGTAPTFRKVADLTTPFLFFSVYIIAHTIFGDGIGYTIAGAAIVIMILFAIYEKKQVKDFEIIRFIRKVWRLFFLILVAVYVLLIITGLILKLIEHIG